ncbi:DNA-directed RNA polymerase I subunit rpa2 [Savitreella phatthalungensis]
MARKTSAEDDHHQPQTAPKTKSKSKSHKSRSSKVDVPDPALAPAPADASYKHRFNGSTTSVLAARPKTDFGTLRRQKLFQNPPKDKSAYPELMQATKPHVDSFDALFDGGILELAANDIEPVVIFDRKEERRNNGLGNRLEFKLSDVACTTPQVDRRDRDALQRKIYPSEARERLVTYRGRLSFKLSWRVNDDEQWNNTTVDAGQLPIMVRSNRCHLHNLSPSQLVHHKEESEEMGGYFIVNGIEKLIRMLILPRRNNVIALVRGSFQNRGSSYTEFGTQIRSVRPDQTSLTNTMHYLSDGTCVFRFSWQKNEYLVPAMMVLKALVSCSDLDVFNAIVGTETTNTFLTDRVELLLRGYKSYALHSQQKTLEYLGAKFRIVMAAPEDEDDEAVGRRVLRRIVLVHLTDNKDKFQTLIFMIRKLYALVAGECCADNPDSPAHQEILLGGFLYGQIMKEKLEDCLRGLRSQIALDLRRQQTASTVDFFNGRYLSKALSKVNCDVGKKLNYFLSTGNLVSNTGLDLQQTTGYTVVAEKLNFYRFLSHFRMVHRGAFFAELKTTTVRKLLPESWGFLCPVHTPDGSPCGLLNHLAHKCQITTVPSETNNLITWLQSQSIDPVSKVSIAGRDRSTVQLDGRIIGSCSHKDAAKIAQRLREAKVRGKEGIPLDIEIGFVPPSRGGQYPGLFLFANASRMMRPVKYLGESKTRADLIGSFEQVYMDIACLEDEVIQGVSTHQEYAPTSMLSVVANLTPFSDFNQSPRCIYQCQMGKQTMGTPATALRHRTDNKLYRIQTPQTPIVRPAMHDQYGMDNFPQGTNAVVAVISYTGYDMEDAMIINKSAHERGFGYGSIYKSQKIDLKEKLRRGEANHLHFGFGNNPKPKRTEFHLDQDGLPFVGVKLTDGDPLAAYYDDVTGKCQVVEYHGSEDAYVDEVRVLGSDAGDTECQVLQVQLRVPRSPVIGDKFSSRHGQKGVCSQKYPAIDMPFSESGMQPDVIINPHAFPSRMTIGMFVESIAGKAGALKGCAQDATPFTFSEQETAADFFGKQLAEQGFNYHGNEPMYSGVTGEEFKADIYIGLVYYQRLRHMVNDKFQVRTTGPISPLTHQPVKGRKRGGGIRFGEMERDSIIAHGASFILQDRLNNCSDYDTCYVCRRCGSILSTLRIQSSLAGGSGAAGGSVSAAAGMHGSIKCLVCAKQATGHEYSDEIWELNGMRYTGGDNVAKVAIPYVFRYLSAELAAMNIKMTLKTK